MELAVLGTDEETLALAQAALRDGHSIHWIGDVRPQDQETLADLGPHVPLMASTEWEAVLDPYLADATLLGKGTVSDSQRLEQLLKLVGSGLPVLVAHPYFHSVLALHEVDMVRREKGTLVRHFRRDAGHPWVPQFREWVQNGTSPVGAIGQLTIEHNVSEGDRPAILRALADDIQTCHEIMGSLVSVSAAGPRDPAAPLLGMSVQLTSTAGQTVRWSPVALKTQGARRLLLDGQRGRLAVDTGVGTEPWRLQVSGQEALSQEAPSFDAHAHAIRELEQALSAPSAEESSTWDAATRAMEVVDVVELSLQKGRTLEIHHQQLTEDLAFKGTMSAVGCGLLILVTLGLVVVGILGDVLQVPFAKAWPVLLLVLLGLFLLFQLVPKLFPSPDRKPER